MMFDCCFKMLSTWTLVCCCSGKKIVAKMSSHISRQLLSLSNVLLDNSKEYLRYSIEDSSSL